MVKERDIKGTMRRMMCRIDPYAKDVLDLAKRQCTMSFSSEAPAVQRDEQGPYREVLSHAPGAMNSERINGGAPLLSTTMLIST